MQQLVFAFSIAHTLRMLVKHWGDAMYFRELIALSMALQMSQYVRLAAVIERFFLLLYIFKCGDSVSWKNLHLKMRDVSTLSSNGSLT